MGKTDKSKNIKDKKITNFHIPRWNELPNIDIYSDQLVTYI